MKLKVIVAVPVLAAGVVITGCSSGSSSSAAVNGPASASASPASSPASSSAPGEAEPVEENASPASSGYWTEQRLLAAAEWRPDDWSEPKEGSTPTAKEGVKTLRVGALFYGSSSGGHFCTGSVVDSPGQDVIATAAHCLNEGKGGADRTDVAFIPAYADGETPFGVWQPAKYVMDSRWVNGADPNLDVAFVVLKPHDGKNIQQVLGGNSIQFNPGFEHKVRVTGYPASADAPIACDNTTKKQDPDYLEFACANFYGGTSGSPWVTNYNAQTRTGTIVGVLGGYEEGGATPDISYSDYLGDDIKQLYDEAAATKG
jgi:V8-like Glu-specific endopeptidase